MTDIRKGPGGRPPRGPMGPHGAKHTGERKPGGFARPAGPVKPGSFAKPVGTVKPGAFARPVGPAKPGGFAKPVGTARPGGFAKPVGSAKPGGFSKPAGAPRPGGRGKPLPRPVARPVKPAAPAISLSARMLALDVLADVHQQDAYASLALNQRLTRNAFMSPRDKRLATELVYGTLENQMRLDYMLDCFLERKDLDPVTRDILRLGAYQLFFLDRVPGSAAVDESVKLTRAKDRESLTGLVNAVLRNMIRDPGRVTYPSASREPVRHLSVLHSVPEWLVERLMAAYGPAGALAIVQHRASESFVTVRPNTERMQAADFEAYLTRRHLRFTPGVVPGTYRVEQPGDLTQEPEYQKGFFSIQGESSMLAAQAVGAQTAWSVLDACAAPGGKTAVLAEALHGTGRVHAWDVHAHRVELVRSMVKRLHFDNVRPAERDASVLRQELEATMDAVLVDAPCSGLGVMLNKPDVKYRQTPETVASLTALQARILDTCCRYVKPGGVLVYATCSILPEENAEQVEAFLAAHPQFRLEGLAERLPPAFAEKAQDGKLQLLAHRDGIDGFFIARMVWARG